VSVTPFGSKSWHVNLVLVLVVVLLVGTAAGFGGFRQRTDEKITVQPGDTVTLALGDVRVLTATTKPPLDDSGNIDPNGMWVVKVHAQVRATGGPISTTSFDNVARLSYTNGRGARITKTPHIAVMTTDDPTRLSARSVIPPSDQFLPVEFLAYVDDGLVPDDGVQLGLFPVVYGTASNAVGSDSHMAWKADSSSRLFWTYQLRLDLTES